MTQSIMRLSENLRTVTNPEGAVVLDIHKGKMFRMNAIGSLILELLADGSTEERIVVEISERCGIDTALASADVRAFLATLSKWGLLAARAKPGL